MQITLYGMTTEATLNSNGYATKSALTGSLVLEVYEINYEQSKFSEMREIWGGVLADDNLYRETFQIVTERVLLEDFGTYQSNLITLLKKRYKYIAVDNYSFVPFTNTLAMPFEVSNFSINKSGGRKWFTMTLEKANAKS